MGVCGNLQDTFPGCEESGPGCRERIILNVNSSVLNRILTLLAWAGVYVAGVLTVSHIWGKDLPCGPRDGCNLLAQSPYSKWGGVPIAVFGLAAYLALALCAFVRSRDAQAARPFAFIGLAISSVGTLVSLWLIYLSLVILNLACYWCLASAGIMTVTFFLHLWLSLKTPTESKNAFWDKTLPAVCALLAIGLTGYSAAQLEPMLAGEVKNVANIDTLKVVDLVPDPRYFEGPADAPITIVEYADVYCGGCRATYQRMKQYMDANKGRIRIAFRHFPLYQNQGHQLTVVASVLLEYAMTKGRFHQLLDKLMEGDALDIQTIDALMERVAAVGLDPADAQKMLDDPKLFDIVYASKKDATDMKLMSTPTFLIFADSLPTKAALNMAIFSILSQEPYASHKGSNGG